jgi:hypothetical protein
MGKSEKSDVTIFWSVRVGTKNRVNFDHFAKKITHFSSLFEHFPENTRSFFLPPGIYVFFQAQKKGVQKRAKIHIFPIFAFSVFLTNFRVF